jgi:hypothetical protein
MRDKGLLENVFEISEPFPDSLKCNNPLLSKMIKMLDKDKN